MSLLVGALFVYAFVKISRVTEDVIHNREQSVRFFIWNIFEIEYIHHKASLKRQKKNVFCNIIPRFRSFSCLSTGLFRKKYTFWFTPVHVVDD